MPPTANPVAARASSGVARRTSRAPASSASRAVSARWAPDVSASSGPAVGGQHERLHDLRDVAPDRARRVLRRLRPLGEPLDVGLEAELARRRQEPVDRAAHAAPSIADAISSASVSRHRRVSVIAGPSPNRSTSDRTSAPSGEISARPHTTTARTPASAAAPSTPATVLPDRDCASSLPSPVMTRSARARPCAKADRVHHDLDAGAKPRAEERHQAEAEAAGGTGARLVAQVDAEVALRDGREVAERAVEQQDVLGVGTLLRPVHGRGTARAAQRVVDVARGNEGDRGCRHARRAAAGRCARGPRASAPPGPTSPPAASRNRPPSACAMPTPPSFVALPPMHTTTRAGPCSSACPISSPVPRWSCGAGRGAPSRTSASPDALAISTTATSPAGVGASPNGAVTDSPVGPVTFSSCRVPPKPSTSASSVPSPPSAIGTSSRSSPGRLRSHPASTAREA